MEDSKYLIISQKMADDMALRLVDEYYEDEECTIGYKIYCPDKLPMDDSDYYIVKIGVDYEN